MNAFVDLEVVLEEKEVNSVAREVFEVTTAVMEGMIEENVSLTDVVEVIALAWGHKINEMEEAQETGELQGSTFTFNAILLNK